MNATLKKAIYSPITRLIVGFILILGLGFIGGELLTQWLRSVLPRTAYIITSRILISAIVIAIYVFLYKYYEKRKITELSLKGFGAMSLKGFLVGLILISLVVLVMIISGSYKITGFNPSFYLITGLFVAVTTGITEEILLRGIVFRLLEEKLGTVISLIISALLFGLMHIFNPNASLLASLAIALEAGVLLAVAYVYTRNLWFPIFLHAAWNYALGDIYGLSVSGGMAGNGLLLNEVSGPDLITGGAFGPEESIQAVIICVIFATFIYYKAYKQGKFVAPYWKKQNGN